MKSAVRMLPSKAHQAMTYLPRKIAGEFKYLSFTNSIFSRSLLTEAEWRISASVIYAIICLCNCLWPCSSPCYHHNQNLMFVIWTPGKKYHWNLNKNTKIFITRKCNWKCLRWPSWFDLNVLKNGVWMNDLWPYHRKRFCKGVISNHS